MLLAGAIFLFTLVLVIWQPSHLYRRDHHQSSARRIRLL